MAISPKIRRLYENEREEAYGRAKLKVAGPVPTADKLQNRTPSKYPTAVLAAVIVLCIIVLLAAFIPSAFRIHEAGTKVFCAAAHETSTEQLMNEAVAKDGRCLTVGVASILLAEIGQLVFFIALAVLGTTEMAKRVFWAGVAIATAYALAGNAFISEPWREGGHVFMWLETFAPPIIVMAVGYVLKELTLYSIERRHEATQDLLMETLRREDILQNPEKQGGAWLRAYSVELRDQIRRANSRQKDALAELSKDDWNHLIKHEMLAGEWTVDPSKLTAIEMVENARIEAEIRAREEIKTLPPGEEAEIWLNDNVKGTWTARSSQTGLVLGTEFATQKEAETKLKSYHYHRNRRLNGKA